MISTDDYCWFVERTLDQMVQILVELGDELAVKKPDLTGANSPYGIVTHCLGVVGTWGGQLVAGREVSRDREAEFRATGTVEDLVAKVTAARGQLRNDIEGARMSEELRSPPPPAVADLRFAKTQGAALFHLFEELAQHLGQMDISRDILLAGG